MPDTRVLLIRQHAAPTDDIYVTTPLQYLLNEKKLTLSTLDFRQGFNTRANLHNAIKNSTHVIVSRYCPGPWLNTLSNKDNRTFKLFYLVDDDIPAARETHSLPYSYRIRMSRVASREFTHFLKNADRVLMTSTFLEKKYRSENVDLIHPVNPWPLQSSKHISSAKEITLSYHATAIHQKDLAFVSPVLCALHNDRQDVKIEIVTDGRIPSNLRRLLRCHIRGDMPWPAYKQFLLSSNSNIGLAPLLDTPFNRGKSHVKLFSITAVGAAGLYSDRPPYSDIIEHGVNGILVKDDPEAWYTALIDLVDNLQRQKEITDAARETIAKIGNPKDLELFWTKLLELDD